MCGVYTNRPPLARFFMGMVLITQGMLCSGLSFESGLNYSRLTHEIPSPPSGLIQAGFRH